MYRSSLALRLAVAGLMYWALGCSSAEFGGQDIESGQAQKQTSSKTQVDKYDAGGGKDEADAHGLKAGADDADDEGSLGNAQEEDDEDGDGILDEDDDEINSCRYFQPQNRGKTEVLAGGPPLAVDVASLGGTPEGDDLHFDLVAYSGCDGARAEYNGNIKAQHELIDVTGMLFGVETNWEAICGRADQWQLEQFNYASVKHPYRGVIKNYKKTTCVVEVVETRAAFWTREEGGDDGGCFALSTPITLANGKVRTASLLDVGDELWNPVTKKAAKISAVTLGPETKVGMYVVQVHGKLVRVTSKHPFDTAAGLKTTEQLTTKDSIIGEDGKHHPVQKITQLPPDARQMVINFVLNPASQDPRDHMILAGGVVTGDLYLQRELAKKARSETAQGAAELSNFLSSSTAKALSSSTVRKEQVPSLFSSLTQLMTPLGGL